MKRAFVLTMHVALDDGGLTGGKGKSEMSQLAAYLAAGRVNRDGYTAFDSAQEITGFCENAYSVEG